MWIEYDTDKPTLQWENQETMEIIQSYGNDTRYPEFKAKLDSGEIIPVKWEDSDTYKAAVAKQEAVKLADRSLLTKAWDFVTFK